MIAIYKVDTKIKVLCNQKASRKAEQFFFALPDKFQIAVNEKGLCLCTHT